MTRIKRPDYKFEGSKVIPCLVALDRPGYAIVRGKQGRKLLCIRNRVFSIEINSEKYSEDALASSSYNPDTMQELARDNEERKARIEKSSSDNPSESIWESEG